MTGGGCAPEMNPRTIWTAREFHHQKARLAADTMDRPL